MKVVILCGGMGTRIRDVADDIPKPMILVGNHPILWHIMKYYATFGHNEFILCLGYKSSVIKDYFLNYKAHTSDFSLCLGQKDSLVFYNDNEEKEWKITFAETGPTAMTGARVRKIQKYIEPGETFFLTYGDGLSDVDLNELEHFHRSHGKILTLTGVRPAGRFGELMADSSGRITEFNEKPQATEGRINGGFFISNYRLFEYLDPGDDIMFEQEPMLKLVEAKELMQFNHDGFWQPMDTFREYSLMNSLIKNNKAPWKKWD